MYLGGYYPFLKLLAFIAWHSHYKPVLDPTPKELIYQFAMSKYPDYLTPNGTPTKGSKGQKSRARREPSGVFSLFQAPQIQQFKEAFQLIDHDKDGWVNESDLKEIFSSLGRPLTWFWVDLIYIFLTFQEYHLRDE